MSCYLGFQPTDRPNYFFVSYNSEDVDRIGPITQRLCRGDVPLWYDYGLEYGEKWESQITGRLKDAQAVLLFFPLGVERTYSRKRAKTPYLSRFFRF